MIENINAQQQKPWKRNAILFLFSQGITLFGAMYSGFLPLGMVVFGPLSDVVSMRFLMILSGALLIVMAAVILFNRRFYLHRTKAS